MKTLEKTMVIATPKKVANEESLSIENLISQAVSNNVPIETIERLLAMRNTKIRYAKLFTKFI
jgi:hypothetical protein